MDLNFFGAGTPEEGVHLVTKIICCTPLLSFVLKCSKGVVVKVV